MPTAAITGASRGLGLTLARFLAAQDWSLVVTARGHAALEEAARELTALGDGRVVPVSGDVSDAEHRAHVADAVRDLGGALDLLVNNASALGATPLPALTEYPLKDLSRAFDVNVLAPVALVQALHPALGRSPRALVVNVSSDAALGGYAGWGGYGATKAALDLVSKTLANELSGAGVGVVAVDPGDMRTRMHQDAFPDEDISDRPDPDATLPFWAWLLAQDARAVTGARYRAQEDSWRRAA